jgi:hypothetical protein
MVSGFDVAQTDHTPEHPHPWEPQARHAAIGDPASARAVWNAIIDLATDYVLTVSAEASHAWGTAYEFYAPRAGCIGIRPGRDLADMTATLARELAHHVTHEPTAYMSRDARSRRRIGGLRGLRRLRPGHDASLRAPRRDVVWRF